VADVFVSYSRRDGEFVRRFAEALTERGKDVWVDVDGIRDAEVFPAALRTAVEQSDGFVFVISPDSVASDYCEQEVEHALELNKRIVPLLLRTVPDEAVPEGVRVRNWIPCRDTAEFEPGVARVLEALDTDLDWTKGHTRWLLKALEWDAEAHAREHSLEVFAYQQAGDAVTLVVGQMLGYAPLASRLRLFTYFQGHDQQASGTGQREHYFGVMKSDGSPKGGLTTAVIAQADAHPAH